MGAMFTRVKPVFYRRNYYFFGLGKAQGAVDGMHVYLHESEGNASGLFSEDNHRDWKRHCYLLLQCLAQRQGHWPLRFSAGESVWFRALLSASESFQGLDRRL